MLETVVACARFMQFVAAALLFGVPLFLLYGAGRAGPTTAGWTRRLVRLCAALLLLGTATSLFAQTATMAGDPAMAFDGETLGTVLSGTTFGYAIIARLALAVLALLVGLGLPPARLLWLATTGLGALILASFAWTGHGASETGPAGAIHAAADVIHLIAAGVWLGALAALGMMVSASYGSGDRADLQAVRLALANFSGVGSVVVAALLASGLVNSWFLVGPSHLTGLFTSPYGQLLLLKVGLFALMLALAASNRFRLTPRLGLALAGGGDPASSVRALRRSLLLESGLGLGVVALVSILGMLEPVSAQI
jgi:putative copper resistance protein D